MTTNKCYKNDPPFFQCCCECTQHLPTHIHCTTIVNRKPQTCVCSIQTGWACVPRFDKDDKDQIGRVYTNWPEHSVGCEMHDMTIKDSAKNFVTWMRSLVEKRGR